jgi:hypothetical protein
VQSWLCSFRSPTLEPTVVVPTRLGASSIASERIGSWRDALLAEIGRGRCVSSRGRYNPRGVKRKMSNFKVRRRGAELHRRHEPTPVLRVLRI